MTSHPGDLTGCSLLAVFAHPDDESLACGGLLAWCAQLGARVSLLCATHGEAGPVGPGPDDSADRQGETRPTLVYEDLAADPAAAGRVLSCRPAVDLGAIRAQELAAAANVLGVTEVVLLSHPDGSLPWVDAAILEGDIRDLIQRTRPDVVITFGADGLYWHPDHIAIHERTTAVVAALGDAAPALYYVTMPPGSMRAVVETVTARINDGHSHSQVLGIDDADAFGALAAPPDLIVDVGDLAVGKLAALRCHRTQSADGALALLTDADAVRLLRIEHFHRATVGSAGASFIERFGDNARRGGLSGPPIRQHP